MLSKEKFEKHMNELIRFIEFEDRISEVCITSEYDCEIRYPSLIDGYVELLAENMDDTENEWISYWLFELDCGKKYVSGSVTEADGTPIPLMTISDLYALLIS